MTSKDLLFKILDYNYLWILPHNINSEPARIRLKEIEFLLDVFGLSKKYVTPEVRGSYNIDGEELNREQYLSRKSDWEYFIGGDFLSDRAPDANTELLNSALSTMRTIYPDYPDDLFKGRINIRWLFTDLLNFRQSIYNITYPWGGMLEGFSLGLSYSKYLQYQLKETIKNNTVDIDNTLCLILDPLKRDFDNNSIGYEEIDLAKIDLEWRMENY